MPRICGIRLQALFGFYRARVRDHPVQELLAGLGIAIGVALVFAVQVANSSITGSAEQIVHGITGNATLQLAARSDRGFDEHLAEKVQQLPGVRRTAPLLRARSMVRGPRGEISIELFGATPALGELHGPLTKNFGPKGLRLVGGIAIPAQIAEKIGTAVGRKIEVMVDGRVHVVAVSAVLGGDVLGPLANSRTGLAPLPFMQTLSGREGRLSQLLVEVDPGQGESVRRGLERIADGHVSVAAATAELDILEEAAKPNDQSTSLFAAISAMVGFLFALNAMLLTMAERRRFVADLRLEGAAPRQIVAVIAFEALMLGVVASLIGLALGALILRVLFGDVPDYLVFAFPVGSQRVVHPLTVALAVGAGVLAALVASLRPVLDLRSRFPVDAVNREGAEPGEAIDARVAKRLFAGAVGLVCVTTVIVFAFPAATVVGGVTLALATVMVMPAVFSWVVLRLEQATGSTRRLNMLSLAAMELRGTTTRSMALASIAAVAVYGSVAIGGARDDLVRGFDRHTVDWMSNADLWVTPGGRDLMTTSFRRPDQLGALARAPGIAAVRIQQGSFLDVGNRRVWLIGRPPGDRVMVPPSQLLEGDLVQATRRLRQGGWATVSTSIAKERDLHVGDDFVLPTPAGASHYRVAAITTNLGWVSGAVAINTRDYSHAFQTTAPSALQVDLREGSSPSGAMRRVQAAVGPGLRVETRDERQERYFDLGREGVARLSQIAALLLVAAALAVACALTAMVWQRRPRLAAMRIQGARRSQLWHSLLFEAGLLVLVGCTVGAVLGVYGHLLAGRYLRLTTGFSAPFSLGVEQLLIATSLVAGIALLVSAVPGYIAASAPIRTGFQE